MKIDETLAELEGVAAKKNIKVTYENIGGELGAGGLCKVKGEHRVIVDKRATDGEKVTVFNQLYLNTGTYTVSGNMLHTKAMVAKSAFAIGGAGNQYEFTVNGNSLVLTQKPSGAVIKLARLE